MTFNTHKTTAGKPIVVCGGCGHGHVVIDLLRTSGEWDIRGIVDNLHPPGSRIMGIPVLGDADRLPALLREGVHHIVVAIGDCTARAGMLKQALDLGFQTPSLVHPSCVLYPSAVIGPACVLCAMSVVGAQSVIGAAPSSIPAASWTMTTGSAIAPMWRPAPSSAALSPSDAKPGSAPAPLSATI
jgi:hypothetical protein